MKMIIRHKIEEASSFCGIPQEHILKYIREEWISPVDPAQGDLDDEDLARIQLIHELIDEMGVNDEAVPIILHLIDQLNLIHLKIKE